MTATGTSPDMAAIDQALAALRAAGAARVDAVGWHYIETLAERTRVQSGPVQRQLFDKLHALLSHLQTRMQAAAATATDEANGPIAEPPSPLAALLADMAPPSHPTTPAPGWRAESPRVRQFRKQLSRLSVHKQVTQAIAQAPQNAGPINSHMLVLRALGLMRDLSPDYLNRFMTYLDTLLCLEEAEKTRLLQPKSRSTAKSRKA